MDGGRPTILVVEDEALILFSIAEEQRDAGFSVLEAHNAAEALRLLEANDDIRLIFTISTCLGRWMDFASLRWCASAGRR